MLLKGINQEHEGQTFTVTNQLLAGLTLTLVTLYLKSRGKSAWYTGIPAVFMLLSTFVSMGLNLSHYISAPNPDWVLISIGATLASLGLWIIVEALIALRAQRLEDTSERAEA